MKKIFKSWITIFVLTLLSLVALFYVYQLQIQAKPPSKGLSRGVLVKEISNSIITSNIGPKVTSIPIPGENRFMIFWNENNLIKYVSINKDGLQGRIKSINIKINQPIDLKAILNRNRIDLYSLESKKLKMYSFDYKTERFETPKIIADGAEAFTFDGDNLFIAGDNYIRLIDKNGANKLIDKIGGEVIDVLSSANGMYKIASIKTDIYQTMHINYTTYNTKSNKTTTYVIGSLMNSANTSQVVDNMVIGEVSNRIHIILPVRDLRGGDASTSDYNFDEKSPKKIAIDSLQDINGYNPNPVVISRSGKEISFLASVLKIKGNKTETYNLREFIIRDGELIPGDFFTNTDFISGEQHLFKLGNATYIQWAIDTGGSKKIMFASTNPNIIKTANKLKSSEYVSVLLDSLMALGFGFSYLLLIFGCIIFPTLFLVIIASAFFLNWVEAHNKLSATIAAGVHVIAEFILTSIAIMNKPDILALTPGFMHNSLVMYGIVLILGLISYYCVELKYKGNKFDKSFVNQYVFFAVINMLLFSLLFFPYYYL